MKGETSGNTLAFVSATADCDCDCLLINVTPRGPTCHTRTTSCFGEESVSVANAFAQLYKTIEERAENMPKNSYTASLLSGGLKKMTAKISEEALEVVQAARQESKKRLIEETTDLLYHLFVLDVYKKISLRNIFQEIYRRKNKGVRACS